MATLSELKQKKSTGSTNPDSLKVLSKDDIRKIMPNKEDNTAKELMDEQLGDIDKILQQEMNEVETKEQDFYDKNKDDIEDAIFDAPVEDIDAGILYGKEAEDSINNALSSAIIENDPNIKAGVDAVSNVNEVEDIKEEDIDDLLNELDMYDEDDDDEDETDIVDDDDDDDEEDEEAQREEQKEMIKSMQNQISDSIKPINDIINIKSFTVSKKPKRATKVLESYHEKPTATWVLLDSGVPFVCSALGAVEIENLDPNKANSQNGRLTALKQMYGTLFAHYESPNKPKSLEEWLKTISFADQDNLIFGYYKATFGLSNLITYACDKCKTVKVENVPIENCIKYKNDEVKERVEKILNGDPTYRGVIKANRIQISDTLVVDIKNPSIYNMVFEFGVLDSTFTNKFADVLGLVAYIDAIYEIDRAKQELVPIEIKEDAKNIAKSVKRRIRAKVQLLRNLTSDQYNILTSEITKLASQSDDIKYCQPEYTCKCGNKINETIMTSQELLFMRHQLALIKTLSVE